MTLRLGGDGSLLRAERDYRQREKKMAPKKVTAVIKLQVPAQKASPAPPVGPALGPHGVRAPQFVQQFNDRTKGIEAGMIVPVCYHRLCRQELQLHYKNSSGGCLIKKACGIESGSAEPQRFKVAKIPMAKLREIAELKHGGSKGQTISMRAVKIIGGTARSMGGGTEGFKR